MRPPASPAPVVVPGGRLRSHLDAPLFRNGYYLILSYGATSVLGLAFWVVAARLAPSEVVGRAAAVFSLVPLVSGISQLSLNNVLMRFVPVAGRDSRRLIATAYVLAAGLSLLIGAAAGVAFAAWTVNLAFLADPLWAAAFAASCAGWTIFVLQDGALTGGRQARWVALENLLSSAGRIVLLLAFAAGGFAIGTGQVFAAAVVPAVIALVPVNLLLFRRLLPALPPRRRGEGYDRRSVVAFAATNYAGSVFATVYSFALPPIVSAVEGAPATAHFYAAWNIAVGLQLIALSMTSSLVVEGALARDDLRAHTAAALRQTLRLVLPVVALVFVAAPVALHLFGAAYAKEATDALRILVLAALPNVVTTVALGVARVRRDLVAVVAIQAALCVLGIGASAALLVPLGVTGAALGWLVGQSLVALYAAAYLLRARRDG